MTDISFRKLDVHRIAKEALTLAVKHRAQFAGLPGEIRSQMERAMASVVLNIAEGAGRWSPADQRRHYQIANGSATEAAACIELAAMFGAPQELCAQIDALLARVCQMLIAMIKRR